MAAWEEACAATPGVTRIGDPVPARSTRFITLQINDAEGAPITSAAQVTEILFTLAEPRSGAIINGREEQDVKAGNGGELSESGAFSLELTPADTRAFGPAVMQPRVALLDVRFDGDQRENHVVLFEVENLPLVS
jgi:hypothetical protein